MLEQKIRSYSASGFILTYGDIGIGDLRIKGKPAEMCMHYRKVHENRDFSHYSTKCFGYNDRHRLTGNEGKRYQ